MLETVKGECMISELATEYGAHSTVTQQWKNGLRIRR